MTLYEAPRLQARWLWRQRAYVAGCWAGADNGETFAVLNPATGRMLGMVPRMGAVETRRAIAAAQRASSRWRGHSGQERAAILRRWGELVLQHQDDLAHLVAVEQGKPVEQGATEIAHAAAFIEWSAAEAGRGEAFGQPTGVCAAWLPRHFPAATLARKAGPALAAGCTVVLKAAAQSPYAALALCVLAERAGLPSGVLSCVTGPDDGIAGELAANPSEHEPGSPGKPFPIPKGWVPAQAGSLLSAA